jgi:hypothetical protein
MQEPAARQPHARCSFRLDSLDREGGRACSRGIAVVSDGDERGSDRPRATPTLFERRMSQGTTVFACRGAHRVEVFFDPRGTLALVAGGPPGAYRTIGNRAVNRACRAARYRLTDGGRPPSVRGEAQREVTRRRDRCRAYLADEEVQEEESAVETSCRPPPDRDRRRRGSCFGGDAAAPPCVIEFHARAAASAALPVLVHSNGERAMDRAEVEGRFRRKQRRASFENASCRACGSSEARAQASGIAERGLRWSSGSTSWLGNGTAR